MEPDVTISINGSYAVIKSYCLERLTVHVNLLMADRWRLVGGICVAFDDGLPVYAQALERSVRDVNGNLIDYDGIGVGVEGDRTMKFVFEE